MKRIRTVFINKDEQWRIPWRILTMAAMIAAATWLINVGWRAAGLPGGRTASDWQQLGIVVLIVGATFAIISWMLRFVEKRGLDAIWLPLHTAAWKYTAIGTLLGAIPVSLMVAAAVFGGYGDIVSADINTSTVLNSLLPLLLAAFLLAGWEELVMRGYLLRQLALARSPLFAVVFTGILFGLAHSGNPGANWQGLLYTALGGTLMGFLLLRTGSLWLLVGYHFGWNASSGNLFGLAVSGMEIQSSVWQTTLSGSDWFTGGGYGFESALPTVVCELLVLGTVLTVLHRKKSQSPFRL